MKYLDSLNDEIREYFNILSPQFPEWLLEYIETEEMKRLKYIGISCGTDYTKVYKPEYWYSNLEHSVGVALIIWNFTKDKKQTLAGLFHDISTPVFKHCIDFLNGDHETQESTEEYTTKIIENSKQIMPLLQRDGIKLEEVNDYKLYPLADNDTPGLSADRFEYTFSSGLTFHRVWDLDSIRECYTNIVVLKNETGLPEIGFKDLTVGEKYISVVSKLWPTWITNSDKAVMQFLADMVRAMYDRKYITLEDLYTLSEEEAIKKILNCEDTYLSNAFKSFQEATQVFDSEEAVVNKYCVSVKAKKRYTIPLVQNNGGVARIYNLSAKAKRDIDTYLSFKTATYAYFDFEFNPDNQVKKLVQS